MTYARVSIYPHMEILSNRKHPKGGTDQRSLFGLGHKVFKYLLSSVLECVIHWGVTSYTVTGEDNHNNWFWLDWMTLSKQQHTIGQRWATTINSWWAMTKLMKSQRNHCTVLFTRRTLDKVRDCSIMQAAKKWNLKLDETMDFTIFGFQGKTLTRCGYRLWQYSYSTFSPEQWS
jgi:hypothetical protein